MRVKLVFFRHQGRKWRNIPMVNVMCLETTIWNFIEIREICDGSAAPALHITQPTRSKKLGQLNFQNSFFSAQPLLISCSGVTAVEANMSGGRFVKVDFDQPLPSQPAAARVCLTIHLSRSRSSRAIQHISGPRASISQLSLAKSMPVSVQSIFILHPLKLFLAQYFVESKLFESPSYCHFQKFYVPCLDLIT